MGSDSDDESPRTPAADEDESEDVDSDRDQDQERSEDSSDNDEPEPEGEDEHEDKKPAPDSNEGSPQQSGDRRDDDEKQETKEPEVDPFASDNEEDSDDVAPVKRRSRPVEEPEDEADEDRPEEPDEEPDDADANKDIGGGASGSDDGDRASLEQDDEPQPDGERETFYRLAADHREIPRQHDADPKQRSLAKLPNMLEIRPLRFDPTTFDETDEPKVYKDEITGKDRYRFRGSVIRWRFKKGWDTQKLADASDDTLQKPEVFAESNARFIKWSDGSRTLMVGKDHFEVVEQDTSAETLTHVFRRHPQTQVSEGSVQMKWQVRPMDVKTGGSSMRALAEPRRAGAKYLVVEETTGAPELDQQKAEVTHLQMQRAHQKRQREKKRQMERQLAKDIDKGAYGMNSRYLERSQDRDDELEDEEDFEEVTSTLKKRPNKNRYATESEDEEDSDDAGGRLMSIKTEGRASEQKKRKMNRFIASDDDEE